MSRQRLRFNVGIAGLGLIGGSLALALKDGGFTRHVVAYGPDPEPLDLGLRRGVVDAVTASLEHLIEQCDVVVLAAPTLATVALLEQCLQLSEQSRNPVILTDVASVKGSLRAVAEAHGRPCRRLILGHPIAGSERSGVAAARGDLFSGHRVILTPLPDADPEALSVVTRLWQAAGAEVVEMGVDAHDAILAATSHLPHVLAYTLVDVLARSPHSSDIFRFAAGGFRDFTRIASSDPVMWRDIALANRSAVLAAIDGFSAELGALRADIEAGDGAALEARFGRAKGARDQYLTRFEGRRKRA